MIVLILFLILAGSFGGALALWLQGASFWLIVLGYVGGGWVGLLVGLPLILVAGLLRRLRAGLGSPLDGRQSGGHSRRASAVPQDAQPAGGQRPPRGR